LNLRLVRLCAWLTWLPDCAFFPVSLQTFGISFPQLKRDCPRGVFSIGFLCSHGEIRPNGKPGDYIAEQAHRSRALGNRVWTPLPKEILGGYTRFPVLRKREDELAADRD
jgi:hypothetical protein